MNCLEAIALTVIKGWEMGIESSLERTFRDLQSTDGAI